MPRGFLDVDLPRSGFEKPGSGLICPEYPKVKAAKPVRVVRAPFAFVFMCTVYHIHAIRICDQIQDALCTYIMHVITLHYTYIDICVCV
jgi:hypothetical protein